MSAVDVFSDACEPRALDKDEDMADFETFADACETSLKMDGEHLLAAVGKNARPLDYPDTSLNESIMIQSRTPEVTADHIVQHGRVVHAALQQKIDESSTTDKNVSSPDFSRKFQNPFLSRFSR